MNPDHFPIPPPDPDASGSSSGYISGAGGIASFDQLHAQALRLLHNCDSFVLVVAHEAEEVEGEPQGDLMGLDVRMLSAVNTPMPPMFLAHASQLVAALPLQAMEDLLDADIEDDPA